MRTPEQQRLRRDKRRARKQWHKDHPKVRAYQLYALKLEDEKYYIGMTAYKDARMRFDQHLSGKGAKWTALHKPLEILETVPLGFTTEGLAAQAETELTIIYMERYGISNVRGGALCFMNDKMCKLHYNRYARVRVVVPARNTREIRYQEDLAKQLAWTQH